MQGESRVAWREGLFLRQQHFQQQDRFVDALVRARADGLRPYPWGVIDLKVNQDLAALGKFAVEQLTGVMPDGAVFSIPGDLPPPTPLDVAPSTRDAIVYITLPASQPGAVEFASRDGAGPGSAAVRFLVDEEEASDSYSTDRTRELLEVARPNLRFGITHDEIDGRIVLGLGRVREVLNGALVMDERYIPPTLDIRASPRLSGFLSDIIGRAQQRVDELSVRAVEATEGGSETFASFLLLQALNRWAPQMSHLSALPRVHPERLYELFVGLAGEISTLVRAERRPPVFAAYDHERLQPTFESVFELLQSMLSTLFVRSAEQLELKQAGPGAYMSTIRDHNLYQHGYFYLAVNARVSLDDIRGRFPSVAKIGTVEKMQQIVSAALPGIPLRHAPTPPPQLRVLPGYVYFELDRSVPNWRDFATSSALGLHVAGDWPDLRLELWAVRRSNQ
jgi:type VI secretion system protein ImpJ